MYTSCTYKMLRLYNPSIQFHLILSYNIVYCQRLYIHTFYFRIHTHSSPYLYPKNTHIYTQILYVLYVYPASNRIIIFRSFSHAHFLYSEFNICYQILQFFSYLQPVKKSRSILLYIISDSSVTVEFRISFSFSFNFDIYKRN